MATLSQNRPRVGLVDYKSGNLRSAFKAVEKCGGQCDFVTASDNLDSYDALVVPGQGSFGDCSRNLRQSGLWDPLKEWIAQDRPFLGICVGYQLLFETSEESPDVEGMSVFKGIVRRFPAGDLKVPHMGWNSLATRSDDRLYRDLQDPVTVYFVHSYYPEPVDESLVSARCSYGPNFAASISHGRLSATQFHPEKSQHAGLAILSNFIRSID